MLPIQPKIVNGRFVNRIPDDIAYYLHLSDPRIIKKLQYRYDGKCVVYGVRCQIDNRIYVGSTLNPGKRFHNHLVSLGKSNSFLQAAISEHGLDSFTVHIFEEVIMPLDATYSVRKSILLQREQYIMNLIPQQQLYNKINASLSK